MIKNYVFNHYHQSIIYCIKYQQAYSHIKYDILADFDQISVRTHTRAKSRMFFVGLVMSILKFAPRYYFGLIVFTLLWLAGPSTSKAKVGRYANGQNKRAVELKKYLGLCTFRTKKIFGEKKILRWQNRNSRIRFPSSPKVVFATFQLLVCIVRPSDGNRKPWISKSAYKVLKRNRSIRMVWFCFRLLYKFKK